MKYILPIILFFASALGLQAQDYLFNQFHLSPLNLSPALAGSSCGGQFHVNFRNESFGAGVTGISFRKISASFDKPIQLGNGDKIGYGGRIAYSDGDGFNLQNSLFSLAFNYQKRISDEDSRGQYIIGALDGGAGQLSFDFQGTGGTFRESDFFSDFGFGLGYKMELDERNNLMIGGAFSHVHEPEAVFEDSGGFERIDRRFNGYALVEFRISPLLDIRPRFFYSTGARIDFIVGMLGLRYAGVTHQFELNGGFQSSEDGFNNTQNSLVLGGTYFYNDFGINFSRQFNTSSLNLVGNNIIEASIIYRPCNNDWVEDYIE